MWFMHPHPSTHSSYPIHTSTFAPTSHHPLTRKGDGSRRLLRRDQGPPPGPRVDLREETDRFRLYLDLDLDGSKPATNI